MILEQRMRRNLKHLNDLGYTQEELASLAGVSRVQINRVLNGDGEPRLKTCEQLAVSLGMDPTAMLLPAEEFDSIAQTICVTPA